MVAPGEAETAKQAEEKLVLDCALRSCSVGKEGLFSGKNETQKAKMAAGQF